MEDIIKKIFNEYKKTIKYIRSSYSYIGLTDEEYIKLVVVAINKTKKHYGEEKYKNYLIKAINFNVLENAKEIFSNDEKAYSLIDNFINNNFIQDVSIENIQNNFEKLSKFLSKCAYMPDFFMISKLINNNQIIKNSLQYIFNEYQKYIVTGNIENIFNNDHLIIFIETYCEINNIEISKDDSFDFQKNGDNNKVSSPLNMYLNEMDHSRILSRKEEYELFNRINSGDEEAKKIIIEKNLRLAYAVAKRYRNMTNIDFLDLIQEGNIGLMTAVNKFDYTKGYKFSTYATYWIRQCIVRYIHEKDRSIKLPIYIMEKLGSYRHAFAVLKEELSRVPTADEISDFAKIPVSWVKKIEENLCDTISLDEMLFEDEGDSLQNRLVIDNDDMSYDRVISSSLFYEINNALNILSPREKDALQMRFGLNQDGVCCTLEDIGKKYGITRERARQIVNYAMRKISKSSYAESLKEYLDNPDIVDDKIKILTKYNINNKR